jgi:hypothetical protein
MSSSRSKRNLTMEITASENCLWNSRCVLCRCVQLFALSPFVMYGKLLNRFSSRIKGAHTPQEMNDKLLVMTLPDEIVHIILDYLVDYFADLVLFQGICRQWRLAGLSCPLWRVETIQYFTSSQHVRVSNCQRIPLDLSASPMEVSGWYLGQIHHSAELVRRDEVQMWSGVLLHLFLFIAAVCIDVKLTSPLRVHIFFISLYLFLGVLSLVLIDTKIDIYFAAYNHSHYSFFFTQLFMNFGVFLTLFLIHNELLLHYTSFPWELIVIPLIFVFTYYLCIILTLLSTHPLYSPKIVFSKRSLDNLFFFDESDATDILILDPPAHPIMHVSPLLALAYLICLTIFAFAIIIQICFILYVAFFQNAALEFSYPPYWVKIFPLPLESIGVTLIALFRITILVSMFLSCFATSTLNILHFLFLSLMIFCFGCGCVIFSFSISDGLRKIIS